MYKLGVVGVGGMSTAHIAAWSAMEDVEVVALCDIRPKQMERYPGKRCYLDIDEMLEKEELDILDICTPSYLHADFAVKALEKGIHTITEKPVALKAEDVVRVYDAAHKTGVCFMVAQVLRFWPEYEVLKEIYDSKRYGNLLSGFMSRLGNVPHWSWDDWMLDEERSGLVPFDLHVHDLDFMIYAFGKPENVKSNRIKRPDQDCINAVYEYPGFYIETECAWYAAPYPFQARFRFQFENAVVASENGKLMIYEVGGKILDLSVEHTGDTGEINLPKSDAYANEIQYFADCVRKGIFPDKVKEEELRTGVEILNNL